MLVLNLSAQRRAECRRWILSRFGRGSSTACCQLKAHNGFYILYSRTTATRQDFHPERRSHLLWVVGRSCLVNELELCSKAIGAGVFQQAADRIDVEVFDELPNTLCFHCFGFIRNDHLQSTAVFTLGLCNGLEDSWTGQGC